MPRRIVPKSDSHDLVAQNPPTPALVGQVRSLLAEAQALSARLAALNEVTVAMQMDLDLDEILQTFAREARWVLDFQVCSVGLRDGAGYTEQFLRVTAGYCSEPLARQTLSGVIGRVLVQGQAVLLTRAAPDDEVPAGIQSAVVLPLRHASEVIGTVNFYARAAQAYSIDDLRIAHALSMQVAMAMQNARLLRATRIARDELNTVLESISDAVLVVDAAGRLRMLNTAMRNLVGDLAHEYAGMPIQILLRNAHHGEQRLLNAALLRTIRRQWRENSGGTFNLREKQYIEWAAAPLVGSGQNDGFVITVRDVSERIELEQMRDMLTGMLVHDLRTPLSGLLMGLDMLKLYGEESHEVFTEMVDQSRSSANRLLSLINTILDVRKLQVGRMHVERTPHDLHNVLSLALHSLESIMRRLQIPVEFDVAPGLPLIPIDGVLVQRVLENLLSNALKFTPTNGHIGVGAQLIDQATVEVYVSDTGPGVPEEQRQHIFELYGQASSEHARYGSGIGLAFCKLVVEAHGGTIGVRSGETGGSVFWFTLPVDYSGEA